MLTRKRFFSNTNHISSKQPLLTLKLSKINIGKCQTRRMTEFSGVRDSPAFDAYTSLVSVGDKIYVKYHQQIFEYMHILEHGFFIFSYRR